MRAGTCILHARCPGRRGRRRGLTIIYTGIVLLALCGLASFAVDYGRVQLVKTELRAATDAAARWATRGYAAQQLAYEHAGDAAADNHVNGQQLTLASSEVQVGSWDQAARAFSANGYPRNAVRVTKQVQVPLVFGSAIGMPSCTVRVGAVARCIPISIVGLNSIEFKNNTIVASYDSSSNPNPTASNSSRNASIISNGAIGAQNNGDIRGDVFLGPEGTLATGWTVTGAVSHLPGDMPTIPLPPWSGSGGNPGGIPNSNYIHSGSTPLNGGTYWFNSLTVDLHSALSFNGPATVYVRGDIILRNGASAVAYQSIPANLKIRQVGSGRFETFNDASITAVIIAPEAQFIANNNMIFRGACLFGSIECWNNAEFYFDEVAGEIAALSIVQ